MSKIPYYDPADGRLLNFLSEDAAQQYVADGIAHAVCRRNGRIARLYRRVRERVYLSPAAVHAAASQTTQRVRDDGGVLIAPPWIRGHRRACAEKGEKNG
jgi:hypothetical protein